VSGAVLRAPGGVVKREIIAASAEAARKSIVDRTWVGQWLKPVSEPTP